VGVTSKVSKLLNMGLDRRKNDKLVNLDDPQEWESNTITSALKSYLRNLPEPLMTYRYHNGFIAAVSKSLKTYLTNCLCTNLFFILENETRQLRINDVHILIYRLPKINFEVLKILIKHLSK